MDDRRTDSLPRFKDQVALVVGAAHGIGKAIAVRLGREGADVVIADVDPEGMETTIQEMHREGSRCKGVTCDVRDQAQVEAAVKQVIDWHGRIDILMYIAGIADAVPFLELEVAMWDNTLNINLRGAFLTQRPWCRTWWHAERASWSSWLLPTAGTERLSSRTTT